VFSDASAKPTDRSKIVLHVPSVNATSLGIAQLVIKDYSYPWLHRYPHAIIWDYLFIYLFVQLLLYFKHVPPILKKNLYCNEICGL